MILAIDTPSSAPIKVTDNSGNVVTAEFRTDADGNPVRDESRAYVLVIDPVAVGGGALKIVQEANGAYNGTEWNYAVKVNPDASIPPGAAPGEAGREPDAPGRPHPARRPHPLHHRGVERGGGVAVDRRGGERRAARLP